MTRELPATETGVPVTPEEVAEILENFRPGEVVSSLVIFQTYDRLMKSYRQPLASRVALGRALTAAGCSRTRKRRRLKGGGIEETHCWIVATPQGYDPSAEAEYQARAVIEKMGPGIHSNSSIYAAYLALASEKGWRGRMSNAQLARSLTKLGRPRMVDRGQPSRFFS